MTERNKKRSTASRVDRRSRGAVFVYPSSGGELSSARSRSRHLGHFYLEPFSEMHYFMPGATCRRRKNVRVKL
jgi:hypothetical protein